jgi:hypothetical protein
MRKLWVVEARFDPNDKIDQWQPTVRVGHDRSLARWKAQQYKKRNPGSRTRVRCYVPATTL